MGQGNVLFEFDASARALSGPARLRRWHSQPLWHQLRFRFPRNGLSARQHEETGFVRLRLLWEQVQPTPYCSHRWRPVYGLLFFSSHSMNYGDCCVCYRADGVPLQQCETTNLGDLKDRLRALVLRGGHSTIAVPQHHRRAVARQPRTFRWESLDAGSGGPVDLLYVQLRQELVDRGDVRDVDRRPALWVEGSEWCSGNQRVFDVPEQATIRSSRHWSSHW